MPQTATRAGGWRWLDVALLLAVLLVALGFRALRWHEPLSFDEQWNLGLSTGRGDPFDGFPENVVVPDAPSMTALTGAPPWHRIWSTQEGVLHPPLFILLLRGWREAVGEGDVAAKVYSTVCALTAIGLVFAAVRLSFDRWTATIATLLLAVAATQAYLGTQVRPYATMMVFCGLALYLMSRIEARGPTPRRGALLALLTLPLLLSHYFATGFGAAIAVYLLIRFRGRALYVSLAALACAALIYSIIWLPFAIRQYTASLGTGDSFLHRADISLWTRLLQPALTAPFRLIVDRHGRDDTASYLGGVLYLLPLLLLRRSPRLLPWYLTSVCVLLSLVLLDLSRQTVHLQLVRYLAAAALSAPVLLVLCVHSALRPVVARSAGAMLVAGVCFFHAQPVLHEVPILDPLGSAIARNIRPGEPIIVWVPRSDPHRHWVYLLTEITHEPALAGHPVLRLTHDQLSPAQREALAAPTAWVITDYARPPAASELWPGAVLLDVHIELFKGYCFRVSLPTATATAPSTAPATTLPR